VAKGQGAKNKRQLCQVPFFWPRRVTYSHCAKADGTKKSRCCLFVAVFSIAGEVINGKGWPTLKERVDEKMTVQLVLFWLRRVAVDSRQADGTKKNRGCLFVVVIFIAGEVVDAKGWPTIEESGDKKTALQGALFWPRIVPVNACQGQWH